MVLNVCLVAMNVACVISIAVMNDLDGMHEEMILINMLMKLSLLSMSVSCPSIFHCTHECIIHHHFGSLIFSSPGQRPCELLPSLCVRRCRRRRRC